MLVRQDIVGVFPGNKERRALTCIHFEDLSTCHPALFLISAKAFTASLVVARLSRVPSAGAPRFVSALLGLLAAG